MKICLACSVGGHLTQMLQLKSFYKKYDRYFVTFKNERTKELSKKEKIKFVADPERKFKKIIKCFIESYGVLKKENPDVIITTGAGVALPTIILGKLMKKRIILIESFSRVTEPSLFGKLAYHFSDLTLVQWKKLLKKYPKAIYSGPIFNLSEKEEGKKGNYIFLTVGNHYASFHRLVKEVDKLIEIEKIKNNVMGQIGPSTYIPKNFKWFRYLSQDVYEKYAKNCKFIIAHGGISSLMDGIRYNKKTIAVPRYKKFGEHTDDHQLDIVKEMKRLNILIPVYDIKNLAKAIQMIENFETKKIKKYSNVIKIIEKYIKYEKI